MITASNHKEWVAAGFMDYSEFSDCITYCNQVEYGDGQLEGDWFYGDENNLVLYTGTFGNYNSPGASNCTYAEQFNTLAEFQAALSKWENCDEYFGEDTDSDLEDDE